MLMCGALRCAVLCCAVLCCAVLCCAVLCCAVLCCAVLCCAVLCCAVLCCAVLCCAVSCLAVSCPAVPSRAMLCCPALLCFAPFCFAWPCFACCVKPICMVLISSEYLRGRRASVHAAGVQRQADFMHWLSQTVLASLYPGGPYERKYLAMLLLNTLLEVWNAPDGGSKAYTRPGSTTQAGAGLACNAITIVIGNHQFQAFCDGFFDAQTTRLLLGKNCLCSCHGISRRQGHASFWRWSAGIHNTIS